MKILLLKDVYHLGHAGDIKKVADGYGRNYLIPQNPRWCGVSIFWSCRIRGR